MVRLCVIDCALSAPGVSSSDTCLSGMSGQKRPSSPRMHPSNQASVFGGTVTSARAANAAFKTGLVDRAVLEVCWLGLMR
jgi:hypothetical protein